MTEFMSACAGLVFKGVHVQTRALAPADRAGCIFVIIEISKYSDESFQGAGLCFGTLIRDKKPVLRLTPLDLECSLPSSVSDIHRHMLPEGGKKRKKRKEIRKDRKAFCYISKINHSYA